MGVFGGRDCLATDIKSAARYQWMKGTVVVSVASLVPSSAQVKYGFGSWV